MLHHTFHPTIPVHFLGEYTVKLLSVDCESLVHKLISNLIQILAVKLNISILKLKCFNKVGVKAKHVFYVVVRPDVGKYVDLLNDVSGGNYERALTCDVAKHFFSLFALTSSENLPSVDAVVLTAVRSFMSAATDEEETLLKLVVLFVCHILEQSTVEYVGLYCICVALLSAFTS